MRVLLHMTPDKKWQLLPVEEFKRVTGRGCPHVGVLEVFAQRIQVYYGDRSRDILVMPRIIPNQRAGAIMSACDTGVPALSVPS